MPEDKTTHLPPLLDKIHTPDRSWLDKMASAKEKQFPYFTRLA
jgi:hypothetical protein